MSCFCALMTLKSFAMTFFSYRFAEEGFLPVAAEGFVPLTAEVGFLPVAAEGFVPLTAEVGSLPVVSEKEDVLVMRAGKEDLASVESLPRHHHL
jgi:hypothetical protein